MQKGNEKINVILDTDTFNECDDQFALSYLIKSQDRFNIDAITIAPFSHNIHNVSTTKSQDLSYKEVIKICNWLDFDENKVYKGATGFIQDGYDRSNDAVDKIIETSLKNEKTYLLAIGAITNIALAIKKEPKIIDKVEVIWLGGNEIGYAENYEYNFRQDIKAVEEIFESKVKLTIIPSRNVASKLEIKYKELKKEIGNKSELCDYLINRFNDDGYHEVKGQRVIWDIAVVAYMINPSWFKTKEVNCPTINNDSTYNFDNNNHNITFVTKLNREKIYQDLFKKLGE